MIQMINPSPFTFIFREGNYKRTFKSKSLLLKKKKKKKKKKNMVSPRAALPPLFTESWDASYKYLHSAECLSQEVVWIASVRASFQNAAFPDKDMWDENGILQVLGAFFHHVYSKFEIFTSVGVFATICDVQPLACLGSALCVVTAVTVIVRRRNTPTFKDYRRLGWKRKVEKLVKWHRRLQPFPFFHNTLR